jgi:hypothetical protein
VRDCVCVCVFVVSIWSLVCVPNVIRACVSGESVIVYVCFIVQPGKSVEREIGERRERVQESSREFKRESSRER